MAVFPTTGAEWPAQKDAIEVKIAYHQKELEVAPNFPSVAFIQGQIAALRWLIGEAEPEYRPGTGSADYR